MRSFTCSFLKFSYYLVLIPWRRLVLGVIRTSYSIVGLLVTTTSEWRLRSVHIASVALAHLWWDWCHGRRGATLNLHNVSNQMYMYFRFVSDSLNLNEIPLQLQRTAWYLDATWPHHDDEPMHHHAVTDRPVGRRHQLRESGRPVARPPARPPDGRTEARAVTVSSVKLMSFVVRCGANGAHELKKIALGRSDRPLKPAVCTAAAAAADAWRWCVMQNQMTADDTLREADRQLMQLARSADNTNHYSVRQLVVPSTDRPRQIQ